MNSIEALIRQSGKITVSVVLKTLFFVVSGSAIALVLWILLLPLFGACGLDGEAAVKCVVLFIGVLFLALGAPFLFFWFGKDYALKKALYSLYDEYKKPVLMMCAEKACTHKESLAKAHKFKHSKFFKELPLVVRLVLSRIDLSFLLQILKEKPEITPQELELELEKVIRDSGMITKPKALFFWVISGVMLLVFFGLKTWI